MDAFNLPILAFVEGWVLIGSPCIFPILPIIIQGALQSQSIAKPSGIALGFLVTFSLFTYFSRQIVQYLNIDIDIIRQTSLLLLLLFGLVMTSNWLTKKFEWLTQSFSNLGMVGHKNYTRFELINGFVLGTLIGFVWTPCGGPIFASVVLQTILQPNNTEALWLIFFFSLGVATPLFLLALLGKTLIAHTRLLQERWIFVRKTLGFVMIVSVLSLAYGPITFNFIPQKTIRATQLTNGILVPYPMPEITGIAHWLNSKPLTSSDLKGKVILVDFWTYSCINCIHTLPYIKDWYQKYHDKGLEIIGIHTPEFIFERNIRNVQNAVTKYGIQYPIAMDNDWSSWRHFNNHYWPAHYLINSNGQVVYTHFGEGAYDTIENNIRFLLHLDHKNQTVTQFKVPDTKEIYLGFEKQTAYAGTQMQVNSTAFYTTPKTTPLEHFALQGLWSIQAEKIVAKKIQSSLVIRVRGQKIYAVMGAEGAHPIKLTVRYIGESNKTKQAKISISSHQLYLLMNLDKMQEGTILLIPQSPGLAFYTILLEKT